MLVIVITALAGLVVGGLASLVVGPWGGILPFVLVWGGGYFFAARTIGKRFEQEVRAVQVELQKGPKHIDNGIAMLEGIRKKFAKVQLFAGGVIDAQIGTLHFMREDYEKAKPYLEGAFVRMWQAKVMLAVLHAKKKNLAAADEVLERAAKFTPKAGLMWSVWAYLHHKAKDDAKAIALLNRGAAHLKDDDPTLNQNLLALKNGKKMKMKGYGEQWYQFGLEKHPMLKQAQRGGNVRFARR